MFALKQIIYFTLQTAFLSSRLILILIRIVTDYFETNFVERSFNTYYSNDHGAKFQMAVLDDIFFSPPDIVIVWIRTYLRKSILAHTFNCLLKLSIDLINKQ